MTAKPKRTHTRLGKEVGSYNNGNRTFVYWPEKNWKTHEAGFIVVAPSGARMSWFPTEAEARDEVARKNEKWR